MAITANTNQLATEFRRVAELAGIQLTVDEPRVETLLAPHCPPNRLPTGKMAVYAFHYQGRTLKVGRVGPNSAARYTSHHYGHGRAPSTLARSIVARQNDIDVRGITKETVGHWIKMNTDRCNFLLDASHPHRVLVLLEAFLQCRLDPLFEGPVSRR